jgi:hypothetical protein
MLARLMASELRLIEARGVRLLPNRPTLPGYQEFRQRVLHLASLHQSGKLFIKPLVYTETWETPAIQTPIPEQLLQALEKGYLWTADNKESGPFHLNRTQPGRLLSSNYDPELLSNDEKLNLQRLASQWPPNEILLDIRPDYPGGEYPVFGKIILRSFHAILRFLAAGIFEESEHHVEKDPRTGSI